jgi:hypothetical protein
MIRHGQQDLKAPGLIDRRSRGEDGNSGVVGAAADRCPVEVVRARLNPRCVDVREHVDSIRRRA